jgi:hypothetical protein
MSSIERRFALAALLAILVVATAAAGLDGTSGDGSGSLDSSTESGIGFGSNTGIGSGNGTGTGLSTDGGPGGFPLPSFLVEHLLSIMMVLSVSVPLVYAAVIVWQDGVAGLVSLLRDVIKRLVGSALALLFALLFFLVLLQFLGNGGGGLAGSNPSSGVSVGQSGGGQSITLTGLPIPIIVVGALVIVVAVVVLSDRSGATSSLAAALVGGKSGERRAIHDSASNTPPSRHSIEDAEPTNDVYRAWLTLTRAAGTTDSARTPREVASRAVERGLDADAVADLTDVFREVRYSGHPPTTERERRARAAADRLALEETVEPADSEL